jgi:small subunit ribosomal protein S7
MVASADIKIFNEWSVEGIKVEDPGLQRYVSLTPVMVPKTGARYAGNRFHKSKSFIVERLINKLMVTGHKSKKHFMSSGHNTGKASNVYETVRATFKIIEAKTKKNPVEVFVQALENAAPREEILTIEYGGARYPKAVECAPQRRIDVALRLFAQGAYQKSFNKKKTIEQTLADEILGAYMLSSNSLAISKKLELERQADSSR